MTVQPLKTDAAGNALIIDLDTSATGSITAAAQTIALNLSGDSGFALEVQGTFVGTLQIERTVDGATWRPVNGALTGVGTIVQTLTAPGSLQGHSGPSTAIRVNATAWTSGTATVTLRAGAGVGAIFMVAPLPAGGNVIGTVGVNNFPASQAVSGAFFQTTQPVSLASNTPDVIDRAARLLGVTTLGAGAAAIGSVGVTTLPALPTGTNSIGTVSVGNFPASQVVTGIGTAGTPATGVETVQGIAGGTPLNVAGAFFQATQPVSIATNTPDVTDRAARLLGVATIAAGAAAIGTVGVTALPALPTGANTIGNVGVTTLPALVAGAAAIGTVGVTALPALPTGANSIGTVGVTALPALSAGANIVGKIGIDQTTPGTTNAVAVTALPTLPAGTNTIGAANINTANASATSALHTANATTGLTVGANLPITGYGTALLKVTGTFVASLAFKVSQDAGTTWDAIAATQVGAGDIFTTATLPGSYRLTVTGFDLLRVEVTLTSGSITINGRSSNAVNASKIVKLASGTNSIGTVTIANLPATTGRSDVVLHASAVPSVTAETAYTLSTYLGTTAATGTFYNVTTGKRFRLQVLRFQANFATMSATVTFASVVFRLRASTAAGATTASPLVLTARLDLASNMPGTPVEIAIPDGLEWVGPNSLCVTQISASNAGIVISDVLLSGFEY